MTKQARTTPVTARKPDHLQGRPRGNSVRVSLTPKTSTPPSTGRETGRIVDTPRMKRTSENTKTTDSVESSRLARQDNAIDSIAARLDQWETQDDQRRLEQSAERKFFSLKSEKERSPLRFRIF